MVVNANLVVTQPKKLLGTNLATTITVTKCTMGHAKTQSLQASVQSEDGMSDNTYALLSSPIVTFPCIPVSQKVGALHICFWSLLSEYFSAFQRWFQILLCTTF